MKLENLPKIELHSHLDGSVNPKTIFNFAKKYSIDLPTDSFNSFKEYVQVSNNCDSLKEYLKKFVLPIEIMQREEALFQIAYEYVLNLKKSNVNYAEIRFAPLLHTQKGLSIKQIVKAVISGVKKGSKETSIPTNLILCAMRSMAPEENSKMLIEAKSFLGEGVVAADLAGNEADFPPELHKDTFDLAKKIGYNITIHAGETGNPDNIITSIKDLHASRIGHGISILKNKTAFELVKNKEILLEICPTSNIQTKAFTTYEKHIIKKLIDQGIKISLNTDNMTVSNTSLNKEFKIIKNTFNLKNEDFIKIYKDSVNNSFAKKELKSDLLKKFK